MLVEGLKLLEKYGISVPQYYVNEIPEDLEFPVVAKADVNHKSEKGAVIKDISSKDQLEEALEYLRKKFPETDIVIQKQITGDFVEVIVGLKRDPTFDYFILFGIGGTITELLKDFVILVPPFDKMDFLNQIEHLKLKKLLFGFRNYPKVNLDLIYNVIKRLEDAFIENNLKELEINPLICKGDSVYAVDVRFFK